MSFRGRDNAGCGAERLPTAGVDSQHIREVVMRYALVVLATALTALALSACETSGGYDGVSRFADTSGRDAPYYGPGSPPRDFGDSGSHA